MKIYHFYALISRMKYIQRWGLMRNGIQENVQEHSHMVAVLAHALACIRRDIFGKPADPDACAAAALFHDASEILTGDLPTPVKYFNPSIMKDYKEVERLSKEKLLTYLPDELKETYRPLIFEDSDEEIKAFVKAADRLAAYIKCVEELKTGNTEFKKAGEQVWENLKKLQMPEVEYFIEHFMPSFSLSLDEQE
ncbi:MAG: 5'-deoxynucleotidase [Clostridiales bacterium]|nr:5'-deoxynucleotidase [Clostridiales bacterium]